MSFYELQAEEKRYYHFQRRGITDTPTHFHGAYEFLFAKQGEQKVTVGGQHKILKEGEACFCDRFVIHSFAENKNSTAFLLLGDKRYFEPIFTAFGNKIPPRFFRFDNFALLDALLEICSQKKQNDAGRYETVEGAIKILLAEIAENTPFEARRTDKQSALVSEILKYADLHLSEDLSLLAIAAEFNYSHEHLSRILHKYLAENWNAYVNRLRVRKADMLLKANADAPVLEVALDCGFDSPNTFYRAYKKEFGSPPKKK